MGNDFIRKTSGERAWEARPAVKRDDTLAFYEGDSRLIAIIDDKPAVHRPDAVTVEDQHGNLYSIFIPLGDIVGRPEAGYIAKRRPPLPVGTKVKVNGNWPLWEGYTGEVVLHDGGRFSVYIKLDGEPDDRLLAFRDDRSLRYHIAADQRSVEVLPVVTFAYGYYVVLELDREMVPVSGPFATVPEAEEDREQRGASLSDGYGIWTRGRNGLFVPVPGYSLVSS